VKKDSVFFGHIRDEVTFLRHLTRKKEVKEIRSDPVLSRAVARSLEIIGEAAKQVSPEFRARYPECPWEKMAGMRDVLVHRYFGIDWEIVRDVLEKELPALDEILAAVDAAEGIRTEK
jgi:uncharacterized protein with HEPN domain